MTFDPRGQGRSDNSTPDGEQGSNANPDVFATNLIDAIDFFRSTRAKPYRLNKGDDRATTPHSPLAKRIDRGRLGIVCDACGRVVDLASPQIVFTGCNARVSFIEGETHVNCPYCQAEMRRI